MIELFQAIQSWHSPLFDSLFISLSFLGSAPFYALFLAFLFWNVDKRFGFRLAVLFLFSMTFNSWLKEILQFKRPIGQEGIRSIYISSATGYSFPSGHSQGAATFYSYLWMKVSHPLWKIFGILMILGIGFSRLYLGVHWPGDVLAGWALGFVIVWGFNQIEQRIFKLPFSLSVKLALSLFLPLLAVSIYPSKDGLQLGGFVLGFTNGYFLEDHYLDYQGRTHWRHSLYKTTVALSVLLAYFLLLRPLTHQWIGFYLPVYATAGLWTSFGAPYLFRRLGWEGAQNLPKRIF